jgi:signal transduction histidine kinase
MTGLEDYPSITQAYDAGATDFIVKPINGLLLGHRARYMLRAGHAMQELRESQAKLVQARDVALEGARLKSEFLATISHEIRTPMNGIIGMNDWLLGTELTAEQRDCADMIKQSAAALLDLMTDILDFSKLDAGRAAPDHIDLSLRSVVEECQTMFQERAKQKGLRLHCTIAPTISDRLRGDPARLSRLLKVLLSNAVKFTEQGEIALDVGPAATSHGSVGGEGQENANRIRFAVSDTGIGIDESSAKRIFQPFVQADGSNRRKYGGAGLGLALAKHLAELMGGTIDFESAQGKGSRFWFDLPLAEAIPDAASNAAPPRVLVFDADVLSRTVIVTTLAKLGCMVETVGSVEEFANKCAGTCWTLCLVDVYLVDHAKVPAGARAWVDSKPRTPVIGLGQAGVRPAGAFRIDQYVEKPVTVETLKSAVAQWLAPVSSAMSD